MSGRVWGFSRSGNWKKSSGEAGFEVPAHHGHGGKGQVLFLLRPDGEDRDAAPPEVRDVDLAVVKNRNGASGGTCRLSYDAPRNVLRSRWLAEGERDPTGSWA